MENTVNKPDVGKLVHVREEKGMWTQAEVFPRANFPFGISRANPQSPDALHTHRGFWELAVVYKGEGIHCIGSEEYPIRAGDVFVIKSEQRHGFKDTCGLLLDNICFDPRRILVQDAHVRKLSGYHILFELEPRYRRAHRFESRLRLSPEKMAHVKSLIGMIEHELECEMPGYEAMVVSIFMQAVVFLCRCCTQVAMKSQNMVFIANVISYLETHYTEPIDLKHLQDLAHMSSSSLMRSFKEATGFTPIEYLLHVRISRAIESLRNEKTTVTDAAFAAGFSNSNYFARQFKRIMNTTPSEYRARMRRQVGSLISEPPDIKGR